MNKYIPLLFLLVLMPSVSAVSIDPGNSTEYNCTGNESINITCTSCNYTNTTCPDYGQCSINTSIYPGDTYNNSDGVCDISLFCNKAPHYEGQVYFPGKISIDKNEANLTIDIEIRDQNGALYQKMTYPAYYQDILSIVYPFNFSCPAELVTEVNVQTCAKYMNEILNTSDPVLAALSLGQSSCTDKLVECYGNIAGHDAAADNFMQLYNQEKVRSETINDSLAVCSNELYGWNGSCKTEIKELESEKAQLASPLWMWGFWIVLVMLGVSWFFMLFAPKEGG